MRDSVRAQRRWVMLGMLGALVWAAAKIAIPQLAAAAIDDGIKPDDGTVIVELAVAVLAVGAVQAAATILRRYGAFRVAYRIETDLRHRLFAHLQRLHFAFHDEAQTGQLMARAISDIQQINQVMMIMPLASS